MYNYVHTYVHAISVLILGVGISTRTMGGELDQPAAPHIEEVSTPTEDQPNIEKNQNTNPALGEL